MPKVSINILTKNRAELLSRALFSIEAQTFRDFEVIAVNDGSTDQTMDVLQEFQPKLNLQTISHQTSVGIIQSRQDALWQSQGEYLAILDDDDEWADADKLKKQVEFLDSHPDYVMVGGGITIKNPKSKIQNPKFRPQSDQDIRNTMLLRNNFFTSTIMFRRQAALQAGGFLKDGADLGEDYDLWLRLGKIGKMGNFQEVFTAYRLSGYNKVRFKQFLKKQLYLIARYRHDYAYYWLAALILRVRLYFNP